MAFNSWIRLLVASALCLTGFAAWSTDYYVDAVNGNDNWDGTTPAIPAAGTAGPRQTLVAAMALAGVGDTVYAAEGTYDKGGEIYTGSGCSNRVVILPGRRLVARGSRDKTIIKGYGYDVAASSNSVRCVLLVGKNGTTPGGILKGFTITGGNTHKVYSRKVDGKDVYDNTNYEYCGGGVAGLKQGSFDANGLVVECDIYNNTCADRGANVFCTTLLRCRVGNSGRSLDCYYGTKLIDSYYYGNQTLYWMVQFYNCTHSYSGNVYGNDGSTKMVNSLFLSPTYTLGRKTKNFNCFFRVACPDPLPESTTVDADCRFKLTAEELAMSPYEASLPTTNSVVMGKGNVQSYLECTNGWLRAWQDEFTLTDLNGRPRLRDGQLDVGCCQASAGALYVDAENGADANNGLSAAAPVKTLARAMELSLPGDTVWAAEGVYDEGEVFVAGNCSNRVLVLPGRRLVASGRREHTIIMGALATDAGGPNVYGCGSNAVRCVYLSSPASGSGLPGGVVKGFTIQNGRTHCCFNAKGTPVIDGNGDTTYVNGGGVVGNGLVVDCDFVDCGSGSRGPNACQFVTLLRCRLNPAICGNYDCFQNCKLIDSLYLNTVSIYQNPNLYNCTVVNPVKVYSLSSQSCCYNCLFLGGESSDALSGQRMHYTNCVSAATWKNADQADYDAASCRFGASVGELACGGARPWRDSIARGAGSLACYLKATNGWHAAWCEEFTLKDCGGRPRVVDGKISVGCYEYAELFADAVNGNDENDGFSPATAKKTLAAVIADSPEPMTVNIAPGVYDEGSTVAYGLATRAVVPTGWAFEGAGRGLTIIKGARDDADTQRGLGPNAVRCAAVEANGYLRGVTLQGGRTDDIEGSDGSVAAGVFLYGAVVDSEITDCVCGRGQGSDRRGAAAYGSANGCLIRCYIHDNTTGLDVHHGTMVGCVFDSSHYGAGVLLNCWFEKNAWVMGWSPSDAQPAFNCVFGTCPNRGRMLTNCVVCAPFEFVTDGIESHATYGMTNNGYDATSQVNVRKPTLDAKFRPLKGDSLLVDKGSRAYYEERFPTKWTMFKDIDISGGARVLNGAIDIGAGEYDWTEDFADVIHPRNAEVTEAGNNLTIANDALVFSPGDTLAATWTSTRIRWANFTAAVPAGGTLVVKVNGVAVQPENGAYRFLLNAGANELYLAYSGGGTATVGNFKVNGFVLIIQ